MSKIKLVTDTTSYIKKEDLEALSIEIVPLGYSLGEENFKEGLPGEFDEFYRRIEEEKLPVKTSQPSAGEFLATYERIFQEGYDEIIAIVLSSKLSGTYNSALTAKEILGDKKVTVIDSETSAGNLKFLLEDAAELIRLGKTSGEIEDLINKKKLQAKAYLTVDSLEYLARGGRLGLSSSIIGNFLSVKPIIELGAGELKLIGKVRGRKQVIRRLKDQIDDQVRRISICYIGNYEEASALAEELKTSYPGISFSLDELGPVIGAHLGPKSLGICLYK